MEWKIPKAAKVYEAYSAIADERITMHENWAEAVSSDGSKKYEIVWDQNTYASSDNASYWQKTLGYPLLAVLMLQGRLTYDPAIAEQFKGIPWKKINKEYKNDYDLAAASVLQTMQDPQRLQEHRCEDRLSSGKCIQEYGQQCDTIRTRHHQQLYWRS